MNPDPLERQPVHLTPSCLSSPSTQEFYENCLPEGGHKKICSELQCLKFCGSGSLLLTWVVPLCLSRNCNYCMGSQQGSILLRESPGFSYLYYIILFFFCEISKDEYSGVNYFRHFVNEKSIGVLSTKCEHYRILKLADLRASALAGPHQHQLLDSPQSAGELTTEVRIPLR